MKQELNDAVLGVENLEIIYGKGKLANVVLKDFSFELKRGEIVALLGESGSGKSTCGKALLGILPASAKIVKGFFSFKEDLSLPLALMGNRWKQLRGKNIALIYQDAKLALNPLKTIQEHFKETLVSHGMLSQANIHKQGLEILSKLNFSSPDSIYQAYPFELSGGMCQRIYIALCLCLQPEVLIADEPTSALDVVSQKDVLDMLKNIRDKFNVAILLITHDVGVAYAVSDRVIVLNKGKIVEEGTAQKVLLQPRHPYTKDLVSARQLLSTQVRKECCFVDCLLKVNGLCKCFSKAKAEQQILRELSFVLNKGEILGVLGQSGCGKSTLAKCLTGLTIPEKGEVFYHNQDISKLQGKKRRWVCGKMQIIMQDARASLNPRRTALELVKEPLNYLHLGTAVEREEKAQYYLHQVGITKELQNKRAPQLSTGQCQRVAIARALVVEPDLLVCDEAVSALDMILQKQILELIKKLQKRFGFAIIMISHDIRVIRNFCHHVAVMKDGSFLEKLPTNRLTVSNSNEYVRNLLACEIEMKNEELEGG